MKNVHQEYIYYIFYVTHRECWCNEKQDCLWMYVVCRISFGNFSPDKCRSKRSGTITRKIVSLRFNLLQYLSRPAISGTTPALFSCLLCGTFFRMNSFYRCGGLNLSVECCVLSQAIALRVQSLYLLWNKPDAILLNKTTTIKCVLKPISIEIDILLVPHWC